MKVHINIYDGSGIYKELDLNVSCMAALSSGIKHHEKDFSRSNYALFINGVNESSSKYGLLDGDVIDLIPIVDGSVMTAWAIAEVALWTIQGVVAVFKIFKKSRKNDDDDVPSYTFSGASNPTVQGNPQPLPYGRSLVTSSQIFSSVDGSSNNQIMKVQDVVSRGLIVGLANGVSSVFFDEKKRL